MLRRDSLAPSKEEPINPKEDHPLVQGRDKTTRNVEAVVDLPIKAEIVASPMARTVTHVVKEIISSTCRSTSKQGAGKPRNTKKVQELGLDTEDDDQFSGELFIGELSVDTCYKSPWIETIQIQDFPVKFKLDTGQQ